MSRWLLVLLVLVSPAAASEARAQAPLVLSYGIEHETWGDIGTFSNTIRREAGTTLVEARLRIEVSVLFGGLVLYREEAERLETWEDGRLAAYESATTVDGEVIRISGRAEGEQFLIQRPDGEIAAPAGIHPTNLWSLAMASAETVMGTKSGSIVSVAVIDGGRRGLEIGGREIETRYYRIEPRSDPKGVPFPQEGWFDAAGIPVRFAVIKDGDSVVFTMTNYAEVLAGWSGGQ